MEEFVINLNHSMQQNDVENILILLESFDKSDIRLTDTTFIKSLLRFKNEQITCKTTKLIAECAKNECNRNIFTDKEIIQLLLNILESKENFVLNVVRALGNIFYENENATNMLDKNDFDAILKKFYELETSNNMVLLSKMSGLLLNIFISNSDLQFVNKNQLLNHISSTLGKICIKEFNDYTYHSYLLQIVYTLMVEYDEQIIYSEKLHKIIIDILKNSNIPELELICLQILYNASEKGEKVLHDVFEKLNYFLDFKK